MKILVTGGAGYLGSVLIPKLLVRGHQVRVVDLGYFGMGHLRVPGVELVRDDLRRAEDSGAINRMLDGVDCVLHLAAISNDPSADLNPELTEDVNFKATVRVAEAAKKRGIRFVFSSSCSVYGEIPGTLDEGSPLNPLTVYAVSKVKSEQALTELADKNWKPVILRNGTLQGYSPHMRFDLVVNTFSLYSVLYGEVKVFGNGLQWRPYLHVSDCARAFVFFSEPRELEHICYNVVHENLRVVDVVEIFKGLRPGLKVVHVPSPDLDARNYRASSERLRKLGFESKIDVRTGAENIMEAIVSGQIPDPESVFYRNAKWLKELTQAGGEDHRQIVELMEHFSVGRRMA
jgi:nucleoside-diphosphate-sugar epimerase